MILLAFKLAGGGKIPRWKDGETVQFAAYAGGYPTRDHALLAAYKLNDAANRWNDLGLRVKFKWVSRLEEAAFVLAYGGNGGSTIARAFEPNTNDLNTLFVYQKAFEPGIINSMYNVFLHELGHVLGLRHEFAPEKEGSDPSVQIGPRNPLSVMSYTFPPQIQPSDETSTRVFYDLPEGIYQGLQVLHVIPDN
ncbi:catalytic domain-containingprotein [Penicillium cataractarum]|uniref:Catalytic domain-containingprotein n=1 Tax=Penicillium cataractarum TaxID=2100454 RepID=A0A9W9UVP9_9EURO|nr:catalytic domain-containingprotein [Penicillium cataractarum]KAJ5358314.1 catalytic domain-containingprotein [Penicillium cataractarum]